MAFILDKVSEDTFYENLFLGLTKLLEKNYRIQDIRVDRDPACTTCEISLWEQIHNVRLPEDLKLFYMSTNGFHLTWKYIFSDQEILRIGSVYINRLIKLIPLAGYRIYAVPEMVLQKKIFGLRLAAESKVFELTQVDEASRVCLVYTTPRHVPTIWLLDTEMNWHYLAPNFTKYLSMAIVHLGVPYWQYCFTMKTLPSWVEQIIMMSAPHIQMVKPIEYELPKVKAAKKKTNHRYKPNKLDPYVFKNRVRACAKSTDLLKHRRKH